MNNTRNGIWLMVAATFIFAVQDGISMHLTTHYNVWMVVMIRYWFFAAFVMAISARQAGGLRNAACTRQPLLQMFRGMLLAAEICVAITSFVYLGLVQAVAIFICYPLLVAALSGPVLGESVGWRRWAAIGIGFIGVIIILQPGFGVFQMAGFLALASALMFALYALLTRYAARQDSAITSFFWTGVTGCVVMTIAGITQWQAMLPQDWGWMAVLCMSGALGHFLLIKCYEQAEASAVQPFAYLHLVFSSFLGILVFNEAIHTNVAIGACIVVTAGLFTLWRERLADQQGAPAA